MTTGQKERAGQHVRKHILYPFEFIISTLRQQDGELIRGFEKKDSKNMDLDELLYFYSYSQSIIEGEGLPFSHRSVHHSRCRSRWRIRCTHLTGTTHYCYSCCVGKQALALSDSAGSDTWSQGDLLFHSTEPPMR